jgi:hypothetical protein
VIKIPLHSQLTDLGVEPGKLGLSARIGACPTTENRGRTIKQLLLPGVNLVRVKLIFGRQRGNPRLIPQRLQRDLLPSTRHPAVASSSCSSGPLRRALTEQTSTLNPGPIFRTRFSVP